MKKTLAILLSLALMICMIPATAATAWAEAVALTSDNVKLNKDTAVYDGKQQSVYEIVTVNGKNLTRDTDYTVSFGTGDWKSVGKYTVTVTGKTSDDSGYSESVEKEFNITKYDLSKVRILIDNQVTSNSFSENTPLDLSIFGSDTVRYYVNGNAASDDEVSMLKTNIQAKLTKKSNTYYSVAFVCKSGSEGNFDGTVSGTNFSIVKDISSATVTNASGYNILSDSVINAGVYDGKNKDLASIARGIKVTVGSEELKYGTDYTFVCDDTKSAGTHDLIIKGIGNYGGAKSNIRVTIAARSSSNVTWNTIPDQTIATMNDIDPVLRDNGLGITLTKETDYWLGSTSGSEGNKGYISVTLSGNYGGTTLSLPFNIVSSDKNVANMKVYYTYNYNSYDTDVKKIYETGSTYTGYSQALSGITVYSTYSQYGTKTQLSTSYYDVVYEYTDSNNKVVSTTSPKDAKTYTVYIQGKNGYAGKKEIGTYTIPQYNLKNADVSITVASATSAPSVSVRTAGGVYFTKDVDYTVSSYASSNKANVYVTISPTTNGNLTGYLTKTVAVNATSISYCTVSFSDGKTSAAYTGYTIPKTVVVKYGSTTLTQGSEYDLTIKNAAGTTVSSVKDAGTYTFTITGKNGWYGSTNLYFTVTGNDISTYTVVLDKTSIDATGYAVTLPKVTKVYSGSTTLSSTNYTVSYRNAAGTTVTSAYAPGTYKVAVTGAGKYSGTAYATFTIVGKNQTITGVESTYKVYPTSDAFKLSPKATEGTFTYTSSDNTVATVSSTGVVTPLKAGRAKITIKTTGNTKYNPAEFSTVIKVYPTKAVMTKKPWTAGKGKIKVRWNKQDNVTRYEIRYSRVKSFASGTYITKKVDAAQNDYTTQSTTIKNLQSGQKYYVKVRAVKEVYNDNGKKLTYYGSWSGWRSIKVQ